MNKTIDFYENNAKEFVSGTLDVVFSEIQDKYLSYIPDGGVILDFGCGSGRDAKYFLSKGYIVEAVDGSDSLCKIASANIGINVRKMLFSELTDNEKYDGIWACASILHMNKSDLNLIFDKMIRAVKHDGYIYTSFKYGDFEGFRGQRFYSDFTEDSFGEFISVFSELVIEEEWVSSDVRPGRDDEKWLNIIMKKVG